MNLSWSVIIPNAAVIAVTLIALGVMLYRGALRERALALGPDRDLGLPLAVYRIGVGLVCLFVVGMLVQGGLKEPVLAMAMQIMPFALIGLMIGQAMQAEGGLHRIGLLPRRPGRDVCWAGAALVIGYAMAGAAMLLAQYIGGLFGDTPDAVGHQTLRELQENPSAGFILTVVINAVIMAPLLEEPVFRGILQTSLVRVLHGRRWPALLITAILFSIVHAWAVTSWHGLVPLFVLGLVFGYVYERTGSLLTPILTHAGFNAVNIALLLTMNATSG